MGKWFKRIWDWIGSVGTIQTILSTEFVRTALIPTVWAALTGGAGWLGHLPLMWVLMATALAYAGVMQALLRGSEYRERKDPLNKIAWAGTVIGCDFNVVNAHPPQPQLNRQQRRQQRNQPQPQFAQQQLQPNVISPGILRNVDKMQVGVELRNNATFPISCCLYTADTEINGLRPPRGQFPKQPFVIAAGASVRFSDDAIQMNNTPAGRMAGKMDLLFKYGLPGKERNELRLKANLDVPMEDWGFIPGVLSAWTP